MPASRPPGWRRYEREARELIGQLVTMSVLPAASAPATARLQQFAAGDLAAFESLFREYETDIYAWIMRIVRDRGAAEELTIETFWRIWNARARFDPQRSFGPWARRIATNVALTHLSRHRREMPLVGEPLIAPPEDPAISSDIREKIERAFRELPARLQVAATLALIEEQKYEDIAAALEISVGGVKSRVFRAVRILRRKLRKMGIEP
jgi:RNA polymerase sigma-70 factor, ECF subfamily